MRSRDYSQEVLLRTDSSIYSKPLMENSKDGASRLSETEKLEEACWNGLISEWLPELFLNQPHNRKTWLWQSKTGPGYIVLDYASFPKETDPHYSIDPVLILMHLNGS